MKKRMLLIVSLLLNAGLIAAFFVAYGNANKPVPPAPAAASPAKEKNARDSRAALPVENTTVVTNEFHWASVESADYKEYIANLRAIGCPEQTIRDIVIADVNALYGRRMTALHPTAADFKFWKTNDRENRNAQRERERQARDLEREKRALIKELLGVDLEQELAKWEGREDPDERRYGFLSPEKQEQLKALREKFREQERALFGEGNGWNAENRAKFTALRAQMEAEMARVLTPAEFAEYQLRNSWTARNMRDNLTAFQPTEQEFREIFNLQKTYDDQFGMTRGGSDEAVREQRRLAQQQLEDQMKALLGPDRYKEYTLAQDERYRDIYDFTQRNDLPKTTAEQVYQMRLAAEAERRRIENDQSIPPDQRNGLIAAVAQQTSLAVGQVLGADVFKDYQRRDGGWLNRLSRVEQPRRDGGGDQRGERPTRSR